MENSKRKILILQGLPASGKTTFARTWVSKDPKHRVRINMDDLRRMAGDYQLLLKDPLILKWLKFMLYEAMFCNKDVVLDNTNLNTYYVSTLKGFIKYANDKLGKNYDVEVQNFFDVNVEECIKRDRERKYPIGESVIRTYYNRYSYLFDGN